MLLCCAGFLTRPVFAAPVIELRPGPRGSAPQSVASAAGVLVFAAADGVHGRELWQLPLVDLLSGR